MDGNEFDLSKWPVEAAGRVEAPTQERGLWRARISAGGWHDAIVCHGLTKEAALELRSYVLSLCNR